MYRILWIRLAVRVATLLGLKEKHPLQKLFSAFPGGWPGLGLLLLRALVGVTIFTQTLTHLAPANFSVLSWSIAIAILIIAICLLVGFMTPLMSIVVGLSAVGLAAANVFEITQTLLNLIVLTTAIALLGPGAFSLDARMFGRREILIPHTTRPSKS